LSRGTQGDRRFDPEIAHPSYRAPVDPNGRDSHHSVADRRDQRRAADHCDPDCRDSDCRDSDRRDSDRRDSDCRDSDRRDSDCRHSGRGCSARGDDLV